MLLRPGTKFSVVGWVVEALKPEMAIRLASGRGVGGLPIFHKRPAYSINLICEANTTTPSGTSWSHSVDQAPDPYHRVLNLPVGLRLSKAWHRCRAAAMTKWIAYLRKVVLESVQFPNLDELSASQIVM
jgi:hypothetical protein